MVQTALSNAVGVEGGIWQADAESLAHAFPSYEGTGPKTDLPAAEENTIREVNAEALRSGRPAVIRQTGRSQVLLVQACPLRGPLPGTTDWTMTRTFTAEGPAYTQLLAGLAVLVLTIFGSALWARPGALFLVAQDRAALRTLSAKATAVWPIFQRYRGQANKNSTGWWTH